MPEWPAGCRFCGVIEGAGASRPVALLPGRQLRGMGLVCAPVADFGCTSVAYGAFSLLA
jgi:hypothetical protein